MSRLIRVWELAAVISVLALSATAAPAAPAAPAGKIKVGVMHSLSGTMAPIETALKDMTLMAIDDINAHGGVLGKQLEAVVVDPQSNWPLFAEKARELLSKEKVAVVFGCATSVSRRAVLPVFEELKGLLFYPLSYEGEEISKNVFYTGSVPTQQAIPAVDFLAKEGAKRFVLLGTDYVYPRVTYQVLRAYLASKGVADDDILEKYTPFGHDDYQSIVADIKKFGQRGDTAVISMLMMESNEALYRELARQGLTAMALPVLSLSVGEQEVRDMNSKAFVGQLASWNYFMSLKNPANDAWKAQWVAYEKRKNVPDAAILPTNDRLEAAWIGVHLWKQAVQKAKTVSVNQVTLAMAGQKFNAPDGFTVEMDAKDHHLHKPLFIAQAQADGQFQVLWTSNGLLKPQPWSPFLPRNQLKPDEPASAKTK
ncbi:MAG: ABC transporter substrate-binding protein [Pseudomonadota bacterium]